MKKQKINPNNQREITNRDDQLGNILTIDEQTGKRKTIKTDKKGEEFDAEQLKKSIGDIKKSITQTKEEVEIFKKENNIKTVEFLGVFAAIISFVSISGQVVINKQLSFVQIFTLIPMFAISLILFVICLDILINNKNKQIIIALIVLFFIILAVINIGLFTG